MEYFLCCLEDRINFKLALIILKIKKIIIYEKIKIILKK